MDPFCFIKFTYKSCRGFSKQDTFGFSKQLIVRMKRKTLKLNEKIKLIDFAKKNPTFGCRKLAEIHGIGKLSVASILENEENIQKELEKFEGKLRESAYFLKILFSGTLLNELTFP